MNVVMTLGPATEEPALIARLMRVASRFRLNAAHLPGDRLEAWLREQGFPYFWVRNDIEPAGEQPPKSPA